MQQESSGVTRYLMRKRLYIAVTGTMGVGKTTASRLLAKQLKLHLIEENFGENVFLPRFYKNMKRWSFHSQTFFLMEKINQMFKTAVILGDAKNSIRFGNTNAKGILNPSRMAGRQVQDDKIGVIQDTPIYQDVFSYAKALYKNGSMEKSEWQLYQKIFRSFENYLPKPVAIIYIKASLKVIKQRIESRRRSYEKKIPDEYLELLQKLNEDWMKKEVNGIKLITINTDNLNLVRNQKDKEVFIKQIKNELG